MEKIQEAARDLMKMWQQRYPEKNRSASFAFAPHRQVKSAIDWDMVRKLVEGDIQRLDLVLQASVGPIDIERITANSKELLDNSEPLAAISAASTSEQPLEQHPNEEVIVADNSAVVSSLESTATATTDPDEPDEVLSGDRSEPVSECAGTRPTRHYNPAFSAHIDSTALGHDTVADHCEDVDTSNCIRSQDDLLDCALSVLNIDNATLVTFRQELREFHDTVRDFFTTGASIVAAERKRESYIQLIQRSINKIDAQNSEHDTHQQHGEDTKWALEILKGRRLKLEKALGESKELLGQNDKILDLIMTTIMLKSLVPLKDLIDTLQLPKDKTRSVYKHIADFPLSKRVAARLEEEEKELERDRDALRLELDAARTRQQTARKQRQKDSATIANLQNQLEFAQGTHAQLKREIVNKRSEMDRKFYEDVEKHVSQRMQEEKTKLGHRLHEAELKKRQLETATSENTKLRKSITDLMRQNQAHVTRHQLQDEKYSRLAALKRTLRQGHEVMLQDKQEVDSENAILRADVRSLTDELEATRERVRQLEAGHKTMSERVATLEAHTSSPNIALPKIVAEPEHLDMMLPSWKNKLEHAEQEQRKEQAALKKVEDGIGTAIRQIRQLRIKAPKSQLTIRHNY